MHRPIRWSVAFAGITLRYWVVRPVRACAAALAVAVLAVAAAIHGIVAVGTIWAAYGFRFSGFAPRLGVPAFLHGCSRLVIDANRAWDDATLCPAVSDGTVVPGNVALSERARRCRWEQLHQPYHRAIDAWLHARLHAGDRPALVSIHSFTPELGGETRRWPVAALWNRDGRMALPFLRALRELDGLDAGDNVPYSGRVGFGYTMAMHAEPHGLPHLLIELRQDVLAAPAAREAWIDLLARRLSPLLDDPALSRPFDASRDD